MKPLRKQKPRISRYFFLLVILVWYKFLLPLAVISGIPFTETKV